MGKVLWDVTNNSRTFTSVSSIRFSASTDES